MAASEKRRGLITDFDNTLVNTNDFVFRHIVHTCQKLGIVPPVKDEVFTIFKENLPFDKIFTRLFGDKGDMVLSAYREDALQTAYKAITGAPKLIETLYQDRAAITIVTNRANKLAERLAQASFDPNHFLAIIQPVFPKPDKNAYSEAISLLMQNGISMEDITILGDTLDDYEACPEELKSKFFALTTGTNTREDFLFRGIEQERILDLPDELLLKLNLAYG